MKSWLGLSILLGLTLIRPACAADEHPVLQFVDAHCLGCHNARTNAGDLNLASLTGPRTFEIDREVWENVAAKLASDEMPPPKVRQRPPPEGVSAVVSWLGSEFTRQDRTAKPKAGRVTARRLNRAEYNHTLRDLLGIDFEPAADFPADETAFGFDNISDALFLSPVLLEKYLDAAERAVRTAMFGPEKLKPAILHYPTPVRINTARGGLWVPQDLFHYDETGLSTVHSAHVVHRFPVDGEYSFRLVLNGHRPDQSEPARPAFFIDGKLIQEFRIDATDLEGQSVELRARVTAGEHLLSGSYLKNYHGLPARYHGPEPSTRTSQPRLSNNARGALTPEDIELLRKFGTKIKTDAIEVRVDNRYESIDVGGPWDQQLEPSPRSRERVYACGHAPGQHQADCAQRILTRIVGRAFRRPAVAGEVEAFLKIVRLAQDQGDSLDEALATGLQAVLVSPHFLYRIERNPPPTEGADSVPVSDFELASRLSYFIWSRLPDEELLRLAGERQLRSPGVLEEQVRRMLQDVRARALVEQFTGQWLQFRNIDVVRPDLERFPEFDDGLRLSMRRETERFLEHLIRQDRSVLEILDADYTFLDERLARFYGIPNVQGPEFRQVDMTKARRGGGILAHASMLTVSSYSTRTSPVLRGKWMLENLLNAPPPPPPPTVPPLDVSKVGESVSLRQELEQHRQDPTCAACHARMDPLGFGLDNFNAIGAWRDDDGKLPVDASGSLPGGRTFRGPKELKAILLKDRDAFVRGLAEKLMIYALGRGLERHDRPALTSITARLSTANYRFSELVLGIANSLPFQMRSVGEENPPTPVTEEKPR